MQGLDWHTFIPFAPLHWTSIFHYIILLGALFILVASQSNVSIIFIFILALLAILTGADLYANLINLPHFVIFMIRVGIVGLPFVIAGIAPQEELRALGVILGLLGLAIFATTFLTCPIPFLGDPRIRPWCG